MGWVGFGPFCSCLPQESTVRSIQAHESAAIISDWLTHKDAIFPYDRRRIPRFRQCNFPRNIFCRTPFGRKPLFVTSSIAVRPSPLRPVVRTNKCQWN